MKDWTDVYKLPLTLSEYSWVYDDNENFVFQFATENRNLQRKVTDCINGKIKPTEVTSTFVYENGFIQTDKGVKLILIRGWGYLTGQGALNLPFEEAKNIQDTFAQFIISKLVVDDKIDHQQ
jgi:hypothetical protein